MADDVIRDVPPRFPTVAGTRLNLEKVSWGAIWAGVMVTIGLEALFLSFGVFISAVLGGSTDWTMAWYLVTMGISFYAGAWSSARLSDIAVRQTCILHGLATWGLATLATAIVGGVAGWAAFLRAGTSFSPALWSPVEQWGGLIWGGVMLSFITAYYGGSRALPAARATAATDQQTPSTPIRRAS
jgi:hypothetical protein